MSEKRRDNAGRKSKRPRKKTFNLFRIFFVLLMATVIIGIGVGAGFVVGAVRAMPQIEDIRPQAQETSYVYDNRGEILAPLRGTEHRIMVDLEDIPQEVVDAFIAIEDHRFYDHFGVDLYRIAGAAWSNLTTDGLQGASTITQQLARNAWPIGMEQTWSRKIQEAILALQLERAYHKDQILEMYLNQINLGHGAYGVQAAAGIYFDKDISEVNLEEAALLAAIPKSPEGYSPYKHRAAARNRRNEVLEAMEYHGFIDESVRSGTEAKPIALAGLPEVTQSAAPSFMDYVINELLERYDSQTVYGGGLKIYTTLDLKAQSYIDEAVATHLDENFPLGEFEKDLQTAIVIMDHQTGDILAMKGGRQHHDAREHNRVSQSYRQPGSAMKPILPYSLALEEGWTTASIIDDAPKEFSSGSGRFVPKNYSQSGWPMGVYYGLTTLREAIRRSVNLPAVRTLEALGVGKGPDWVEKFGITSLVRSGGQSDGGLAMALGGLTQGVSPLELTGAYSTFPGGGSRVEPMAITRVEDRHGNVLEDNSPTRHVVMSQQNAYIMTDILRSVVHDTRGGWLNNTGTGWRAKLENDWPAAGKTGTTDDSADLWWVGFTPRYIGAVWLGFDEPDSIPSIVGRSMPSGLFPVQIWKDIMDNLHRDMEPEDFPKPDGIVERTVCIKSGKLPGPDCPTNLQRREIFALGTEPRETCDIHVEMEVCSEHPNLLWDPECVENGEPEMKVFLEREELEPVTDTRGRTLPLPLDMEDIPPEEYCTDVYGTRPEEPSEGEDEEIRWEVTESARVSVDRNGFDPIVVRVPFEAEIEFEIAATGDTDHRIVIDGLGVDVSVDSGTSRTVTVRPTQSGVYHMYCALHSESNSLLHGRFIVERQQ